MSVKNKRRCIMSKIYSKIFSFLLILNCSNLSVFCTDIIVLNGKTCSGKSSITKKLIEELNMQKKNSNGILLVSMIVLEKIV